MTEPKPPQIVKTEPRPGDINVKAKETRGKAGGKTERKKFTPLVTLEEQARYCKEEVENFITDFNLEPLLPPGFSLLDERQQLKVVRDLQKRIVDIVKSDAQTQYSEDLKKKVAPSGNKVSRDIKTVGRSIKESATKEINVKNLEKQAFEKIRNTDEGKKIIEEDLKVLTEKAQEQNINIDSRSGKPYLVYLDPFYFAGDSKGEEGKKKFNVCKDFNIKAHKFSQMPYEWGQERNGKNKKEYEKAKAEYEQARWEILKITANKEKPEERGGAILEMLKIDSNVQMEQLLNTHPEFEKELQNFARGAGRKELVGGARKFLGTITGGKNKLLALGGFGARMTARGATMLSGMTIFTAAGAPIVGGIIGGLRGRLRAKDTLAERQQQARHGQKDRSKERIQMTDATRLTQRLERVMKDVEVFFDASLPILLKKIYMNPEKNVDLFLTMINHTQGKIEKGQINFGDSKSSLVNQYNLVDRLNQAMILRERIGIVIRPEGGSSVNKLFLKTAEQIAEKTSEAQREFIKKQMWKGVAIGAGAATAGYVFRYIGEQFGWWDSLGKHMPWRKSETEGAQKILEDTEQTEKDTAEGFFDRAENWMKKLKFWGNEEAEPAPATTTTLPEIEKVFDAKAKLVELTKLENDVLTHRYYTIDELNEKIAQMEELAEELHNSGKLPSEESEKILAGAKSIASAMKPSGGTIQETTATTTTIPESKTVEINPDAIVHKGEGIENALRRQIEHNPELAQSLGFKGDVSDAKALHKFSGGAAHEVALYKGYVDRVTGEEIRVRPADQIAYQLKKKGDGFEVEEIKVHGGSVEKHGDEPQFEGNQKEDYEYRHRVQKIPEVKADEVKEVTPETSSVTSDLKNEQTLQRLHDEINEKLDKIEINKEEIISTSIEPESQATPEIVEEARAQVLEKMGEPTTPEKLEDKVIEANTGRAHGTSRTYKTGGGAHGTSQRYETIGGAYGTSQRYETIGGAYGTNTGRYYEAYMDDPWMDNPFHLPESVLAEVESLYYRNLEKIFPPDMENVWQMIKHGNAKEIFNNKDIGKDNLLMDKIYSYFHKLYEITGEKPIGKNWLLGRPAETPEAYLLRCLEKAASKGKLNLAKFE